MIRGLANTVKQRLGVSQQSIGQNPQDYASYQQVPQDYSSYQQVPIGYMLAQMPDFSQIQSTGTSYNPELARMIREMQLRQAPVRAPFQMPQNAPNYMPNRTPYYVQSPQYGAALLPNFPVNRYGAVK